MKVSSKLLKELKNVGIRDPSILQDIDSDAEWEAVLTNPKGVRLLALAQKLTDAVPKITHRGAFCFLSGRPGLPLEQMILSAKDRRAISSIAELRHIVSQIQTILFDQNEIDWQPASGLVDFLSRLWLPVSSDLLLELQETLYQQMIFQTSLLTDGVVELFDQILPIRQPGRPGQVQSPELIEPQLGLLDSPVATALLSGTVENMDHLTELSIKAAIQECHGLAFLPTRKGTLNWLGVPKPLQSAIADKIQDKVKTGEISLKEIDPDGDGLPNLHWVLSFAPPTADLDQLQSDRVILKSVMNLALSVTRNYWVAGAPLYEVGPLRVTPGPWINLPPHWPPDDLLHEWLSIFGDHPSALPSNPNLVIEERSDSLEKRADLFKPIPLSRGNPGNPKPRGNPGSVPDWFQPKTAQYPIIELKGTAIVQGYIQDEFSPNKQKGRLVLNPNGRTLSLMSTDSLLIDLMAAFVEKEANNALNTVSTVALSPWIVPARKDKDSGEAIAVAVSQVNFSLQPQGAQKNATFQFRVMPSAQPFSSQQVGLGLQRHFTVINPLNVIIATIQEKWKNGDFPRQAPVENLPLKVEGKNIELSLKAHIQLLTLNSVELRPANQFTETFVDEKGNKQERLLKMSHLHMEGDAKLVADSVVDSAQALKPDEKAQVMAKAQTELDKKKFKWEDNRSFYGNPGVTPNAFDLALMDRVAIPLIKPFFSETLVAKIQNIVIDSDKGYIVSEGVLQPITSP